MAEWGVVSIEEEEEEEEEKRKLLSLSRGFALWNFYWLWVMKKL